MCLAPAYSCSVRSSRAIGDTCAFWVLGCVLICACTLQSVHSIHPPSLPFPVTFSLHADILANAPDRLSVRIYSGSDLKEDYTMTCLRLVSYATAEA